MEDQIIFIYNICDDLHASFGTNKDAQCKMNSAEVMTVAIVAALFFGGNFSKARLRLKIHNYIQNRPLHSHSLKERKILNTL